MPSPFPGMDPYLEAPDIWPDFHDALAGEIRAVLNQTLPAPYYARLEMRPEIGVVNTEDGTAYRRRIVPDVGVVRPQAPGQGAAGGVAVLEAPRTAVSPSVEISVPAEEGRHLFVEVRDPRRGHRLVTLIEIASPSSKHAGVDRQAYLRKCNEVYNSDASLIEIDLLRGGQRMLHHLHVEDAVARLEPPPDYLVLVNRAWLRRDMIAWQLFAATVREVLPCVPVPLREGEPEVPLDLQYVLQRAYNSGPYRRGAVTYTQPPEPPMRGEDADWAAQRLREQGITPA